MITPDAFSVHPQLLGTPLAPPRRRAMALLIDVILVGLITALTSGFWFILGVVVAAFFFTRAAKPGKSDRTSLIFRLFLGCTGVTVLVATVTIFLGLRFLSDQADEDSVLTAMVSALGDTTGISLSGGLEGVLGGLAEGAQPVTWWHAFERAGGYAAGFATGTLGFAQIYWDPNRQAIHDKIAGTVVTLDGAPKVPGRWDLGAQDSEEKTTATPGEA